MRHAITLSNPNAILGRLPGICGCSGPSRGFDESEDWEIVSTSCVDDIPRIFPWPSPGRRWGWSVFDCACCHAGKRHARRISATSIRWQEASRKRHTDHSGFNGLALQHLRNLGEAKTITRSRKGALVCVLGVPATLWIVARATGLYRTCARGSRGENAKRIVLL